MGFYGNVVNTNKTQFVFDKTYPNRYEMDSAVDTDGVFVGRFILVDYDTPEGGYNDNYLIDRDAYPEMGRPYDSTVWQKTYTNGKNKYVMIAELNAVVPTFDLAIDPPTLNYMVPHFDEDSTNIYYKLHIPAQWKVQVKEAESKDVSDIPNFTVTGLREHNGAIAPTSKSYPADIYFGKSLFKHTDFTLSNNAPYRDSIEITPASSGYSYPVSSHDGNYTDTQPDIQELSVHLPSLGQAVSDMWDIVYGKAKRTSSTAETTTYERNTDIYWGNTTGNRLVTKAKDGSYDYDEDAVKTLSGCINSIHDLMGQVIIDCSGSFVEEEDPRDWVSGDEDRIIVFDTEDGGVGFYMIEKNPDHLVLINTGLQDWLTNRYDELYVYSDSTGQYNPGAKWTGTNDATQWPEEIKLGYKETAYEWIELKGFANNLNTIHGLILKINHMLRSGDLYTRDTATVQGSINTLNDIISRLEKLNKNNFIISNNNGQLTTAEGIYKDNWVDLNVQNGNVVINHKDANVSVTTPPSKEISLSYNQKVSFPYPVFDKKGHYVSDKNITVNTLPIIPIEVEVESGGAADGKVVTYVEKHPNKNGPLLASISNLSDIKIKTLPNNNTLLSGSISEEDTIGEILCKLNNRIAALEANLS